MRLILQSGKKVTGEELVESLLEKAGRKGETPIGGITPGNRRRVAKDKYVPVASGKKAPKRTPVPKVSKPDVSKLPSGTTIQYTSKHGHKMEARKAGHGAWLVGKAGVEGTKNRVSDKELQAALNDPKIKVEKVHDTEPSGSTSIAAGGRVPAPDEFHEMPVGTVIKIPGGATFTKETKMAWVETFGGEGDQRYADVGDIRGDLRDHGGTISKKSDQEEPDMEKGQPSDTAKISPEKARQILHDGEVHGHPLTEQQRKFFGAIGGHLPAPGKKKSQAPESPEEEERQEIEREKKQPDKPPPPIPGVKKSDDGKPGESLGETSTEELTQTLKDLVARLKQDPQDAAALQKRREAITAELKRRSGKTDLKVEKCGAIRKSGIEALFDYTRGTGTIQTIPGVVDANTTPDVIAEAAEQTREFWKANPRTGIDALAEFAKGGGTKDQWGDTVIARGPRGGGIYGYRNGKPIYQPKSKGAEPAGKRTKIKKFTAKEAKAMRAAARHGVVAGGMDASEATVYKLLDAGLLTQGRSAGAYVLSEKGKAAVKAGSYEVGAKAQEPKAKEPSGAKAQQAYTEADKQSVAASEKFQEMRKWHEPAAKLAQAARDAAALLLKTAKAAKAAGDSKATMHEGLANDYIKEADKYQAINDDLEDKMFLAQEAALAYRHAEKQGAPQAELAKLARKASVLYDTAAGHAGDAHETRKREECSHSADIYSNWASKAQKAASEEGSKTPFEQPNDNENVANVGAFLNSQRETDPAAHKVKKVGRKLTERGEEFYYQAANGAINSWTGPKAGEKLYNALRDLGMRQWTAGELYDMVTTPTKAGKAPTKKPAPKAGVPAERGGKIGPSNALIGTARIIGEAGNSGLDLRTVGAEARNAISLLDSEGYTTVDAKGNVHLSEKGKTLLPVKAKTAQKPKEKKAKPEKTQLKLFGKGERPADLADWLQKALPSAGVEGGHKNPPNGEENFTKSEVNTMDGIEKLANYGQPEEPLQEDVEKAEPGKNQDDLEKAQSMPTGGPKQKLGQGPEQGGKVDGTGKTSGDNTSGPGPGQDAQGQVTGTSTGKDKLGEDEEEDEGQMKPHKKPIESTAKSVTPGKQREMVGQEIAQVVSRLKKGEGDVAIVGTGLPEQGEEIKLEKGRVGRQGMVVYTEQSDIEAEHLLKSDDFYSGGAPRVVPFSRPIGTGKVCPNCETLLSKSLTACPECGAGTVTHQVLPGGEAQGDHDGEPLVKSRAGKLRPVHVEDVKIEK